MESNKEIWIPIKGYEGRYSVSNFGNIASHRGGKYRILRLRTSPKGYPRVNLAKNGELKTFCVHALVAKHFLPNPNGLTEINHKDENKLNNMVENLEWCTRSYNVNYGTRTERQRLRVSKGVIQYDNKGVAIAEYDSLTKASGTVGISVQHIAACCKKKYPYAGGFIWRYLTEVRNGAQ